MSNSAKKLLGTPKITVDKSDRTSKAKAPITNFAQAFTKPQPSQTEEEFTNLPYKESVELK
jgi:hypothetical protein